MGKYSGYHDEDLMEMADYDHKAEEELISRGFHEDGDRWAHDSEVSFGLAKVIFQIVLILAFLLGTHFLVAFSMDYQLFIYIGFPITFILMFLGGGKSKFLNIIFWIGCWALATRCFPLVFQMIEGADYIDFFYNAPGFWVWIKYGLIYSAYAAIVPYLVMKIVTFIVSVYREKEEGEDRSVNA